MGTLIQSPAAFGRLVRDQRRSQKITQAHLAAKAGLTQATISKIERGVAHPTLETMLALLSALALELHGVARSAQDLSAPWDLEG